MRDAGNKELATVLFDQIGDAQIAWMRKNRCSETCSGIFVRGEVVSDRLRRPHRRASLPRPTTTGDSGLRRSGVRPDPYGGSKWPNRNFWMKEDHHAKSSFSTSAV